MKTIRLSSDEAHVVHTDDGVELIFVKRGYLPSDLDYEFPFNVFLDRIYDDDMESEMYVCEICSIERVEELAIDEDDLDNYTILEIVG